MMTTQKKIEEQLAGMKETLKEWHKSESYDEAGYLAAIEVFEAAREIFEAVEADADFIVPENCRAQDVGRDNPDYITAVAEHAEKLADMLATEENANALNLLALNWKRRAHVVGGSEAMTRDFLTELAREFDIE